MTATALAHPLPAGRTRARGSWPYPPSGAGVRPAARPGPGAPPAAARSRLFRRRRAAVSLAAAVLLGGGVAFGVPGGVPLAPSGPAPAAHLALAGNGLPVAHASYLVRPGDTLWHIARALQPTGDVRPLVHRLAAGRGGAPLRAGERLVLPPG